MRTLLRHARLPMLALLTVGCARVGRPMPAAQCPRTAPVAAAPFDSESVLHLVGSYRLLTVTTAEGYAPDSVEGSLRLAANDTLSRYYIPTFTGYRRFGDRPVAGIYQDRATGRDTVVVGWQVMNVGCQAWMCTDASPAQYRIEWITAAGFGGTWENYQSGVARVVDKHGRFLPNPSGYFCAWRRGS